MTIVKNTALYTNKHILAPMVRVGTLPMRLLALDYGADLVYSPEIVDKAIIGTQRTVDESTGTIHYTKGGKLVFQAHPSEKDRLVFQLGTADPELALQAAQLVKQDVAAIDLNCGCPKKFSIVSGMGAALLKDPEKLCKILCTLVENIGLPVSCKIRLLESTEKTVELCRMIEATGVSALTVHCRTQDERPRDPGHWDQFEPICQAVTSIPVIANGDFFKHEDAINIRNTTSISSVMFARGAMLNPSVFQPQGPTTQHEAAQAYIRKAMLVDNLFQNTKYTLMQMYEDTKSDVFQQLTRSKTIQQIWWV
ncbi:hypothetical protein THASP1DRAFT_14009 [Thamnocephalis sphaerospora]|uniref:tRNA-dihydrouridine synthase n=1 Tax=Thamnocephalis sphaerospora TaxID=78915 RepID=A0A4P9XTV9_9FUNG|nr:hypothetical protein THASP1DRAFT_14009 [Thamnocephalis sphaerospora]|eukprot:RKP09634.1 hypothetical protein THASP1DRAFT_14009 [Thamnocephalis sphaerospora]